MALTRVDCFFYRGSRATLETSSYVALNPSQTPGSLVVAESLAARDSIGSQVACKLALEHFVDGVLGYFDGKYVDSQGSDEEEGVEISLQVLEAAFKQANHSVYSFGHKLAAGGRMAASLIGLVVEESVIAAGKVGLGCAYLFRDGELYPFFESDKGGASREERGNYVGSNSLVAVELASVTVEPSDTIFVFSENLSPDHERKLIELMPRSELRSELRSGLRSGLQGAAALAELVEGMLGPSLSIDFAMGAVVGPDSIYLSRDNVLGT